MPRPRSVETAFVGLPSAEAALDLLGIATETRAGGVTSFELMARDRASRWCCKHAAGCRDPLAAPHPWYVLIELSSQRREGLREHDRGYPGRAALERGLVGDAAIADSLEQAKAFWRIREMFGEVQRHAGGSIKHDVSVPVAAVPAFIGEADAAVVEAHSRRAAAAVRPSRRRQHPLQRHAADRRRQGRSSSTAGTR